MSPTVTFPSLLSQWPPIAPFPPAVTIRICSYSCGHEIYFGHLSRKFMMFTSYSVLPAGATCLVTLSEPVKKIGCDKNFFRDLYFILTTFILLILSFYKPFDHFPTMNLNVMAQSTFPLPRTDRRTVTQMDIVNGRIVQDRPSRPGPRSGSPLMSSHPRNRATSRPTISHPFYLISLVASSQNRRFVSRSSVCNSPFQSPLHHFNVSY